jgi:hypothetical protein
MAMASNLRHTETELAVIARAERGKHTPANLKFDDVQLQHALAGQKFKTRMDPMQHYTDGVHPRPCAPPLPFAASVTLCLFEWF